MKKLLFKIFVIVIISSLVLFMPIKLCADSLNKFVQYNKMCDIPNLDLGQNGETELFTIFYGNNAQNNADKYINKLNDIPEVSGTHRFNTNTNLITNLYIGVNDLKYKTVVEQIGIRDSVPINHRRLVVENAQGYQVSNNGTNWLDNSLNIGSYEIPEMFEETDYLKCKTGRYPQKSKNIKDNQMIEIMVTDGLGLSVGDTCFISLDAIDENDELVVLKASVVGIASKGVFLPYYDRYFSGDASTVKEAYNRIFHGEMIYYPDLSDFYVTNSHFRPDEEEVEDNTTVVLILVDENYAPSIENISTSFDGSSLTHKKGLLSSDKNLYKLETFANYKSTPYSDGYSIVQSELSLVICLLLFLVIFIVGVVFKVTKMVYIYMKENTK